MKLRELLEHVYYGTSIKIFNHLSDEMILEFTISPLTNYEHGLLKELSKRNVIGVDVDSNGKLSIDIV